MGNNQNTLIEACERCESVATVELVSGQKVCEECYQKIRNQFKKQ